MDLIVCLLTNYAETVLFEIIQLFFDGLITVDSILLLLVGWVSEHIDCDRLCSY